VVLRVSRRPLIQDVVVQMPVPVPLRAAAVPLVVLAALLAGCAQSAVPSEPQQPVTSTPVSSGAILSVATPTAKESASRGRRVAEGGDRRVSA